MFVVFTFVDLGQTSDFRIETRQVVCWMQDSNPGSLEPNFLQTKLLTKIIMRNWLNILPVPLVVLKHRRHADSHQLGFRYWWANQLIQCYRNHTQMGFLITLCARYYLDIEATKQNTDKAIWYHIFELMNDTVGYKYCQMLTLFRSNQNFFGKFEWWCSVVMDSYEILHVAWWSQMHFHGKYYKFMIHLRAWVNIQLQWASKKAPPKRCNTNKDMAIISYFDNKSLSFREFNFSGQICYIDIKPWIRSNLILCNADIQRILPGDSDAETSSYCLIPNNTAIFIYIYFLYRAAN